MMKIQQLRGPFNKGTVLSSADIASGTIVKVGIQIPYRTPARYIETNVIEVNKENIDFNDYKEGQIIKKPFIDENGVKTYQFFKVYKVYGELNFESDDGIKIPTELEENETNANKIFIKENDGQLEFNYIRTKQNEGDNPNETIIFNKIDNYEDYPEETYSFYQNGNNVLLLTDNRIYSLIRTIILNR